MTAIGSPPTVAAWVHPSPWPVLEHRLVIYRRAWRGTVFSTFVLPILFLLSIGVSVGAYVNRTGDLDVSYLDYIAPGVLASTVLQVGTGEATWPVMSSFTWVRTYHAMRASPLRPRDVVAGESLYILLRVLLCAVAFLVVMTAFGTVHSWWAPLAVPICLLLGAAVTEPTLAFSATITNDNLFAVFYRFAVIPMTLFAGVFFPVALMPTWAQWLAYVSPLWHGVELCRSATLGTATPWPAVVHIGYLALWAVLGYAAARARFTRRLAD